MDAVACEGSWLIRPKVDAYFKTRTPGCAYNFFVATLIHDRNACVPHCNCDTPGTSPSHSQPRRATIVYRKYVNTSYFTLLYVFFCCCGVLPRHSCYSLRFQRTCRWGKKLRRIKPLVRNCGVGADCGLVLYSFSVSFCLFVFGFGFVFFFNSPPLFSCTTIYKPTWAYQYDVYVTRNGCKTLASDVSRSFCGDESFDFVFLLQSVQLTADLVVFDFLAIWPPHRRVDQCPPLPWQQ